MKSGRAEDFHYLDLFKRLLPPGAFFRAAAAAGRPFEALLAGISKETARIHNRILDAWIETDPARATETLAAWEAMTGLPDDLVAMLDIPADAAGRRAQIHAKLTAIGGNNPLRFTLLAARLGADVVISAPYRHAARVEWSKVEDLLEDGSAHFFWHIEGSCPAERRSRLENLFTIYTPAHVVCEYQYT